MYKSHNAALLELIADVQGLFGLEEFRAGLLDALWRAIPSDYASVNNIGPSPETSFVVARPDLTAEAIATFNRLAHENPLVAHYRQTQDGRVYRFSDLVTRSELHALTIYRELYRPLGVEYQMAFTLPTASDRILGVALSRGSHDYSDAERDLLGDARRFIIQAFRAASLYDSLREAARPDDAAVESKLEASGLTKREAQVVALVARGRSNRDAAALLGMAERTVAKHLQRAFAKLGVSNRSQAATIAWQLSDADRDREVVPRRTSAYNPGG